MKIGCLITTEIIERQVRQNGLLMLDHGTTTRHRSPLTLIATSTTLTFIQEHMQTTTQAVHSYLISSSHSCLWAFWLEFWAF